jgi:zinc/manganese transport system substrate-binding protein
MGWKDRMKRFVIAGVVMMLAACGVSPAQAPASNGNPSLAQSGKLKAVATSSIMGDLVRNVAGDNIDLDIFVGAGADVHDFEPTPSDVAKLANAQLVFENGVGLENWLDNLFKSSGSKAVRVVLSDGIALRGAGATNADGQAQSDHDPHIWQNPQNAMQMVKTIRDALVKADPANTAVYQKNAAAYLARLKAMDSEVADIVDQLPKGNRKLVTSHDSLGYFADRYGFEIAGSVIASLTTEAGEPSAQDLVKLIGHIKQQHVKAIFLESQSNPKVVERIASEAGVMIGPELYTDSLGAAGTPGATYIDAMLFNAKAIVNALK